MRVLTSDALDALESGRFEYRTLLLADMPDDPVGFWDDAYDIDVSGQTYLGVSGGFRVSGLSSASDQGVRGVDITVSGLSSEIFNQIYTQGWSQRGLTLSLALISIETREFIDVRAWFTGFMDQMTWREGDTSELVISAESIARELNRTNVRTRNDVDQRAIDSDDDFFKGNVNAANVPLQWGQVANTVPLKQPKPSGIAGLIDHIF